MYGISSEGKQAIDTAIEKMFDILALRLLGSIPKLSDKKNLLTGLSTNKTLADLFLQSSDSEKLNNFEVDVLKGLLSNAHNYVEALKLKTKSNITDKLDSLVKEAKNRGQKLEESIVTGLLETEMGKAHGHLVAIAGTEATKTRNTGGTIDITRVASSIGDDDPSVFFALVRDNVTCSDCVKNHLMPDGVTPKVFKLSELKHGYLSRAERKVGDVSVSGQHPSCRCSLAYIAPNFGFKKGRISFIALDHNEYEKQKSE